MKRRAPIVQRPDVAASDPHWYKDAVIYEARVRSFYDSNGDGIGDFRGLASKLDYLLDLGVTAIWLLPFYPSPLRDDGYDIADYLDVHPDVGSLADFDYLLDQAHRRGLRVIIELVINHTSDQHPWFQRARRAAAGTPERNFYVWSDTAERYQGARIIFKDFEHSNWTWDPIARAYYWHRFYSHQPDLNFENPALQEALFKVCDFWFEKGVDGMRLDAVPYLYEAEGTNCENLPPTHDFLKALRAHVDERFTARMLLAEANQWPEDAAAYFGNGDECHMNFHFPIMPRMFMSMHMEDRFPILDILAQTPHIAESCQWALFLRNHDELTLEMVTDEERDYMYRAYAAEPSMRINLGIRRRLAPLCGNDRKKMQLLNGLLFSLPGTPVLYYGDEIGMGDNVYLGDRNGVRTPMQWSSDRNAGFSRSNPQRLILPIVIDPEYHYEALNVEAQQNNSSSLLWWMKRLIALRKRFQAFGRGTIQFLRPANHRVLAFVRQWGDETVLVVANLSRFAQFVELDLSPWRGLRPRELFGNTKFPPVGDLPYLLTVGGHDFYWFSLERARGAEDDLRALTYEAPIVACTSVDTLLHGDERPALEEALPAFLETRRWFAGRDRVITSLEIREAVSLADTVILFVNVAYDAGQADVYVLPVTAVRDGRWLPPQAIIATLRTKDGDVPLVEVLEEGRASRALLDCILKEAQVTTTAGELRAAVLPNARADHPPPDLEVRNIGPQHASAAIQYGDQYLLKVFRRLEEGVSPELEVSAYVDTHAPGLTAEVAGYVEYRRSRAEPATLAVLQRFVKNEGTAWTQMREELRRYFERVLTEHREQPAPLLPATRPFELAMLEPPPIVREAMGTFADAAARLGVRTAELHATLASNPENPAFAPEPYSALDLRSKYQSLRNLIGKSLRRLRASVDQVPPRGQADARWLIENESRVFAAFEPFLSLKSNAQRIRTHGDFHLGQVLYTGRDYVIIDFDGGLNRSLSERRRKRSALRDVAGMMRSFHSGTYYVLFDGSVVRDEDRAAVLPWADHWHTWSASIFLRAYLDATRGAPFVPAKPAELTLVLESLLVEMAFQELHDTLEQRSQGVVSPLRALVQLLA